MGSVLGVQGMTVCSCGTSAAGPEACSGAAIMTMRKPNRET